MCFVVFFSVKTPKYDLDIATECVEITLLMC